MTKKGFPEHTSFYSSLICSFANIIDVKMAEELMIEAEGKNMLKDQATFFKFILMYTFNIIFHIQPIFVEW